jgi:hypothetical protein
MEPWHMLGWLCAKPFLLVLSADVEIKISIFGDVVLKQPRLLRNPELLRRGARRAVLCCVATSCTVLQHVALCCSVSYSVGGLTARDACARSQLRCVRRTSAG